MNSSASPEWHRNLPGCANDARCSAFIDYLVSRGYSRNTISAYGRALESALETPLGRAPVGSLSPPD